MSNPYIPYLVTEGFCGFFALTILLRMGTSIGSQREIHELRAMVISYLAMLVFDILCALFESGLLNPPIIVNAIFSFCDIAAISFGCFFWYRYVDARLRPKHTHQRRFDFLIALPLAALILADFISIFTGWLFYIDESNHYFDRPIFSYVQGGVNYFYLLIPTILSLYRAIKTRSRLEKEEYFTYSIYMLVPLSAGLLEDVLPYTPILALNIFLILEILFLMIQNMQIYNDALTNLNNRRHLNRFLEERLPKASPEKPVLVMMIDINGFKAINDKHGHVEGDNALRTFSDVFKNLASKYNAFVARYGGDEFSLVCESPALPPEKIADDLQVMLETYQTTSAASFHCCPLTVSVGYALCQKPELDADKVIAQADEILYQHKNEWHKIHDDELK
jgi:diguanylate cyclase (GGDEF)-like protein